ncbi:MAG: hypothetical protein ACOH2L_01315 [Devosia sp.]
MRIGVTVSIVAHILLLTIGLINLGLTQPLTPVVESISVDLVPVDEYSNIRAGQLDSKVVDTQTPSIVEDTKTAEVAQPTGNTEQDQVTPSPADIPTPAPVTNAAPQPETQPEPAPTPEPEPTPAPEPTPPPVPVEAPVPATRPTPAPVPTPAPEPVVEPVPAPAPEPAPVPIPAPTAEPTPIATPDAPTPAVAAPAPAARPANLEQKRQQFAAAEAERKKKLEEERKRTAAAQQSSQPQSKPQLDASLADDISAIINNDKTTGGTTGKGGTPTLGDTKGTSARLSQSELDGFAAKVKQCWTLLPADYGMSVTLMINMNRDGSVNGTPTITSAEQSASGLMMARAAQRAVINCGPYTMLSEATYDQWRQIEMELRP